eukprot:10350822-Lingulodinium_polyedra.AAC.1
MAVVLDPQHCPSWSPWVCKVRERLRRCDCPEERERHPCSHTDCEGVADHLPIVALAAQAVPIDAVGGDPLQHLQLPKVEHAVLVEEPVPSVAAPRARQARHHAKARFAVAAALHITNPRVLLCAPLLDDELEHFGEPAEAAHCRWKVIGVASASEEDIINLLHGNRVGPSKEPLLEPLHDAGDVQPRP